MEPAGVTGTAAPASAQFEALYDHLRRIARSKLRGAARTSLDTVALVHEAWIKLDGAALYTGDRAAFLALAAKAMRHILVDHIRARLALKRGGEHARVTLSTDLLPAETHAAVDVLDIERGLQALEALDPRLAHVVEMRFYAGMEFDEIAGLLALSERTVYRDWRKARAFLLSQLGEAT